MDNTRYSDPNRHATWLELFFDLIFVVTIGDVTHILSHLFVFIGQSILASLIRHAVLDDMVPSDFRVLSVIGAVCFFIGKQFAYFMERPELRRHLVVNTLVVFVLTGLALLLPRTDYMLLGLTATVICYAFLSFRYQHAPPGRHGRLGGKQDERTLRDRPRGPSCRTAAVAVDGERSMFNGAESKAA